ncbi:endonuclease, partial [Bacteroidia bacterium]|nr:endonuclease [Bacteroidia bacterium]
MRNITLFLILLGGLAQAQVTLSLNQLDFGDVLTTADSELAINVTNTTSFALEIEDVNVFNTDFTYTIPNATIDAGATEKIRVTFKPRHNLMYNTELIFVLSDGSEHRLDLIGNGKYEGTYYDATFNKSYQDLKDELKTILAAGYTNLGYTGARDNMYGDIDNVAGKVTCVYTGRDATFNTRSGANSSSFNCEHTWPQSLFSSNEPEKADIHHLFPTDVNANSRRGSYPFGVVTGTPSWTEGGSKLGGGVFEPRDEQKGATARAMLYF